MSGSRQSVVAASPVKPRVLIAEPDGDVRELIVTYLGRLGCTPVFAPAGPPDFTGVDLILMEPASSSALRLLEAHRRTRSRVPIVCVSILPYERAMAGVRPAVYVAKPFSEHDLRVAIRRALGVRA